MKINIRLIAIVAFAMALTACTKWENPAPEEAANLTPTHTIAELKAMYKGAPLEIKDDSMIIGGKVISSDKSGNFYRSFYIQDETCGIEIKIGKTGLYNDYKEGQTIYVKPKYLCLGAYGGMVQLGAVSAEERYETAYIDTQALINRTVFKGALGEKVTPMEITSKSQIVVSNLGKLVTLKDAVYKGGDYGLTTWATKEDKDKGIEAASGNQNFTIDGKEVVVRSSGYADFADSPCPPVGTVCDVTGVLTVYNSTYQLVILDLGGVVCK